MRQMILHKHHEHNNMVQYKSINENFISNLLVMLALTHFRSKRRDLGRYIGNNRKSRNESINFVPNFGASDDNRKEKVYCSDSESKRLIQCIIRLNDTRSTMHFRELNAGFTPYARVTPGTEQRG